MKIHLAPAGLLWILEHLPAAATNPPEGLRINGAPVVLDWRLPPRIGYFCADDGRRLEFALDRAGIHPVREVVRAAG